MGLLNRGKNLLISHFFFHCSLRLSGGPNGLLSVVGAFGSCLCPLPPLQGSESPFSRRQARRSPASGSATLPRPGPSRCIVGAVVCAAFMVAWSWSAVIRGLGYNRLQKIPALSSGSEACDRGWMSPDRCIMKRIQPDLVGFN